MPLAAALSRAAAFVTAGSCTGSEAGKRHGHKKHDTACAKGHQTNEAGARHRCCLSFWLEQAGADRGHAPSRWRLTSACRRCMDTNRTALDRLTLIWRHGPPEAIGADGYCTSRSST
jgi:hypothetical protein